MSKNLCLLCRRNTKYMNYLCVFCNSRFPDKVPNKETLEAMGDKLSSRTFASVDALIKDLEL